jgi:hypothetical protein
MPPRTKPTPKPYGPKPRTRPRPPTKICHAGHRQSQRWKPDHGCLQCQLAQLERERADLGAADRLRWQQELGPPPAELSIPTGDGSVVTYGLPRGMRRGLARRPLRR